MVNYVIVTGCDSGIGKTTAEYLAESGWGVIACVYKKSLKNEAWARAISGAFNTDVVLQSIDLRSSQSVKLAANNIRALRLSITSLVNVAGIANDGLIQMTRREDMRDVFEVNVIGQIEFSQFCLKLFDKKLRRNIVFVSSTAGISGGVGQLAYASSKAAISNITKTFSRELAPIGVNVNAIAPGVIDTKMYQDVSKEILDSRVERTSLGRIGSPLEVAKTIEFLISDFSNHITGQIIRVDGGLL